MLKRGTQLLHCFERAEDFLNETEDELLRDEIQNNLILTILQGSRLGSSKHGMIAAFSSRENGRHLPLAILSPINLVLAKPVTENYLPLAETIKDKRYFVPGVYGPNQSARFFAEAWTRISAVPHRLAMNQGTFALEKTTDLSTAEGQLKLATPRDEDLLVEWWGNFEEEAVPSERSGPEERRKLVRTRTEAKMLWLWWDLGAPRSLAARSHRVGSCVRVSLVYTPKAHRGRGYASACVKALSEELLREGSRYCILNTDLANSTSNSIYQKIGYKRVGESQLYKFVV